MIHTGQMLKHNLVCDDFQLEFSIINFLNMLCCNFWNNLTSIYLSSTNIQICVTNCLTNIFS